MERKVYRLEAATQHDTEGVEIDIEAERLRENMSHRAQARYMYQKLRRDFRDFRDFSDFVEFREFRDFR